jgi:hypothetical protein
VNVPRGLLARRPPILCEEETQGPSTKLESSTSVVSLKSVSKEN